MPKIRFGVKVMPRDVILDVQGRAVEQTLKEQKREVSSCRVGRYVELEIPAGATNPELRVKEIAETLLSNPLIETYEIQKL